MPNTNNYLSIHIEECRTRVRRNFEKLKERVNLWECYSPLVEYAAEDYLDSIKLLNTYLKLELDIQRHNTCSTKEG